MIKSLFITICLALVAIAANAQTITDELRQEQTGKGKIVINQSEEIERLVNNVVTPIVNTTTQTTTGTTTETTTTDKPAHGQTTTDKPATEPRAAEKHTADHPSASTSTSNAENEETTVNTNKKIMRHSYKATGYRIQVYSGGNKREDRQKCEQISARLKASFPNLPIYVHFYSPSWKCRAGNFTDQSEAKSMLKQIRAMGYSQACLVKGTINVQY